MEAQHRDRVIEAYRSWFDRLPEEHKAAYEFELRLQLQTIQALAEGQPVSAERLAETWGMPVEQARAILDVGQSRGTAQIDDDGNLVGAVLSLVPSHHRIRVNGQDLFAWCAWDAIYVPGVLGKTAQVQSQDPVNGKAIRLTVTPDGVRDVRPEGAVASVVGMEASVEGGPQSARCSQMLFFASRDSAETWLQDHPGVGILTVQELFELAREIQIEPARRMGLVE